MNYRMLGNTGLKLSEIGFGTWGIGGDRGGAVAYGATDDNTSMAALGKAFEEGINFYDTSNLYGHGHAEGLLKTFLANKRSDCVISTKAGFTGNGMEQDFRCNYLLDALDKSLDRMGTDYVDIFMLHSPAVEELPKLDATVSALEKLVESGKVKAWGISTKTPQDAMIALQEYPVCCFQVNFSLVDLRAKECGLLDKAREMNIGLIARTPLAFGFLTGNVSPTMTFTEHDHRARFAVEKRVDWANAVNRYQQCFEGLEATNSQKALLFCLSYREITTTIPGMLTAEHVFENTRAAELPRLDSRRINEICTVYQGV